jgi:FtsZ-binding cell division protein ZapB
MSLIAKACGELKKECQELTAMNKDLKRDSETLKKENETLKKDSEALKKDNEILKRNDSVIKLKLYSIHHALVGNDDPIVPFSIDLDKEKHFYTGICGRRMSVRKDDNQRLMFRVYKRDGGQSQPPVTEIIFDYGFDTHTITKDVCHSYRDDFDRDSNCSQEFVTNMEISPISSLFGKIFIVSIK